MRMRLYKAAMTFNRRGTMIAMEGIQSSRETTSAHSAGIFLVTLGRCNTTGYTLIKIIYGPWEYVDNTLGINISLSARQNTKINISESHKNLNKKKKKDSQAPYI